MIAEFFKQFYSSGDPDELVQFEISNSTIADTELNDAEISISDGHNSTIRMTIADFEHLQKLFKAYQDACDLIKTSLAVEND
jgi:hypothetical protein